MQGRGSVEIMAFFKQLPVLGHGNWKRCIRQGKSQAAEEKGKVHETMDGNSCVITNSVCLACLFLVDLSRGNILTTVSMRDVIWDGRYERAAVIVGRN